jgi:hypothetical protein
MTTQNSFLNTRKFKTLEESVRLIVFGMIGSPDQCSEGGAEIFGNGNEFCVRFYYSFVNGRHLTVRCDLEYQGQCVNIKQINFLH